jgi:DNA-binding NarL/FixJ family response regulator
VYSVLLVSSFRLVREAVRALIERAEDFHVIGETDGRDHMLGALINLHPDVILLDLDPDYAAGIETIKAIVKHHPASKIIVLSMHLEDAIVESALRAHVRGFISKAGHSKELGEVLKAVARGESYLSPLVAGRVMEWVKNGELQGKRTSALEGLTAREIQVLRLLAEGRVNKEIASDLDLGVETIRSYRKSVMKKVKVHNLAELMRFALSAGVIALAEPKDRGGGESGSSP